MSSHQLFLVTLNFLEFFHLQSTLDSEFVRGWGFGYQLFLVMLNLRSKTFQNFFIYGGVWTVNFSEGVSSHQLFLVTLNFLEFFHLQSTLDSELFRGGVRAPTFFGHATFEVKNFQNFLDYRALWTLNFSEDVSGQQLFLVTLNFLEFFHLQSTLDSEFFRGSVWAPTFFIHTKFEVKIFEEFFNYRALWTLNFSEGVFRQQFFLVTLNLRSKIFRNFFIYRVLRTLNLSGEGGLGTNFFWSC